MKEAKKFEECKTLEEQQCWLAQDTINRIKAKKIDLFSGDYLKKTPNLAEYGENKELRDVLREQKEPCRGCAVGSLFLCAVDAYDKLKVKDATKYASGSPNDTIVPYLNKWFSVSQLALIEAAFEGSFYGLFSVSGYAVGDEEVQAAIDFAEKRGPTPTSKKNARVYERRMFAIMKNIIKNNGTFIP